MFTSRSRSQTFTSKKSLKAVGEIRLLTSCLTGFRPGYPENPSRVVIAPRRKINTYSYLATLLKINEPNFGMTLAVTGSNLSDSTNAVILISPNLSHSENQEDTVTKDGAFEVVTLEARSLDKNGFDNLRK